MGKNDEMWNDDNMSDWPSPIVEFYRNLRELASEADLYGTILRLKDVYETCMKIPCVIGIIYAYDNYINTAIDKEYATVLKKIIISPHSMGGW